ncbi:MAG: GerAB/ArcD/ProY family transporter [Bacilli bacterium]|nr:GerAB/ArcD/ProY family transporter [Bacilli bacterium]
MKKISYLEITSLVIIQTVTTFFGISVSILKEGSGINSWLSALLSYVIGIIPLIMIIYISNYKKDLKLNDKINNLFGKKIGFCINILLSLLLVSLAITLLYNINNFILSQFLYRTPFIVSCSLFMLLIIYNANKGINVISKVAMLLLILNIFLYTINISSLVQYIDISNFYPLLKVNTNNIIPTAIKISSINYLPLITILVIPKDKLTTPKKYNKSLIIGYIIGAIISFGLVITTFGVLGIDLVNTFEYSEYIVLRKVKLLGFLERIENIISLQWIIGSYIYLTVLVYTMTKSISIKSKKINTWITTIIGISLIVITLLIFKDNTIFDNYIRNIFPYIISGITLIYILLIIKIFISKTNLSKT